MRTEKDKIFSELIECLSVIEKPLFYTVVSPFRIRYVDDVEKQIESINGLYRKIQKTLKNYVCILECDYDVVSFHIHFNIITDCKIETISYKDMCLSVCTQEITDLKKVVNYSLKTYGKLATDKITWKQLRLKIIKYNGIFAVYHKKQQKNFEERKRLFVGIAKYVNSGKSIFFNTRVLSDKDLKILKYLSECVCSLLSYYYLPSENSLFACVDKDLENLAKRFCYKVQIEKRKYEIMKECREILPLCSGEHISLAQNKISCRCKNYQYAFSRALLKVFRQKECIEKSLELPFIDV